MEVKISVIVPGFNVRPYIRQCLDSLAAQSFSDIQVIMVDDGSTDGGTGRIMDEYASTHRNFQVVHQENAGLGAARNAGVRHAQGNYLAFVDSDDYVALDAYEKMYAMAEQTHSDIVTGGVRRFHQGIVRDSYLHRMAIVDTCRNTHITRHPELLYDTTAWNKLYKKSFWDAHHLSFPENMCYEDIPLTIPAHFLANAIDVVEDPVYYWRIRDGGDRSITQKRTDIENFKDRLKALNMLDSFLNRHQVSEPLIRANQLKYLTNDFSVFLGVLKSVDTSYLNEFQLLLSRELRKMDPELLHQVPAKLSLVYRLVLDNKMDDAIQVMATDPRRLLNFRPYRKNGHWYRKFSVTEETCCDPVCVDESLNAVARIHKVCRSDKGRFEIAGHAYIDGIDSSRKAAVRLRASLVNLTNQKKMELPVALHKDKTVTRKWGVRKINSLTPFSRVYNYDWSSFLIDMDPHQALRYIGEGRWTIYMTLTVQGLEKKVRLGAPLKDSNLADYQLIDGRAFRVKYNGKWQLAIDVDQPEVLIEHAEEDPDGLAFSGWTRRRGLRFCFCYFDHHKNKKYLLTPEVQYSAGGRFHLTIPDALVCGPEFNENGWVAGYFIPGLCVPRFAEGAFRERIKPVNMGGKSAWIENSRGRVSVYISPYRHPVLRSLKAEDHDLILVLTVPGSANLSDDDVQTRQLVFQPAGNAAPVILKFQSALTFRNGEEWTIRLNCFDDSGHFRWFAAGRWDVFLEQSVSAAGHTNSRKTERSIIPVVLSPGLLKVHGNGQVLYRYQRLRLRLESGWHLSWHLRTDILRHLMDRSADRREIIQWYLYPLMRLLPLKKNAAVFESFWGKSFNDNPKAIYEYMAQTYGRRFHYVCFLNNEYTPVPGCIETVRRYSFRYFYYLARGKYFIENTNLPDVYVKRHGQIEMQTLHGTFMKKMGLDEPGASDSRRAQSALLRRVGRWDLLLSPNNYMTELTRRAYLFRHQVIPCGFPRNDRLYQKNNDQYKRTIKDKLQLPDDKKVILYTPTFRNQHRFDLKLDLSRMQSQLSSEYILLFRLHYLVAGRVKLQSFTGFVFDVTSYPDIQDLYLVSDLLITDYSSAMFDYAHLKKPMLFFACDLDYYNHKLRGMYMNYQTTVPGPIAKTTEEVIRDIRNLSHFPGPGPKYQRFYEKYCTYGRGDSSRRAAKCLLENKGTRPGEPYYRNLWKKRLHQLYVRLFRYVGHLPRKKMVLFESFFGTQFSDNPRAVYEYMREHCPDYELIWNVQRKYKKLFQKEHIPYVIKYSFRGLWKWARAAYWVTNSRWPLWLPKPEKTIYIQTWHGTPLKTLGTDIRRITMPGMTIERYKKEFTEESRKWDYCIAPNDYASKIFKRAFELQGTMIRSGYPRNDLLVRKNNETAIRQIKEKLGIGQAKKVILYAPTWRDNQFTDIDHYTFAMKLDLDRMKREFGPDTVLLVRLHYLVDHPMDLSKYQGFVMDVSGYADCRELFLASDCLITDYSSVFFDYAVLKRPIIFYAYDLDEYANKIRGFYLNFRKMVPGPVAGTMDQLIPAVRDALKFTGGNPYPEFYKKFCSWEDGSSSQRAVASFLNHGDRE